jgi:hypothetical protein
MIILILYSVIMTLLCLIIYIKYNYQKLLVQDLKDKKINLKELFEEFF